MTVENLHDAIGLLPGDLIAAADEKRCRKPKRIPFRHYAAVAACLVLVVGGAFAAFAMFASGGGNKYALTEQAACEMAPQAPEAEDQAAPMEPQPESAEEAPAATQSNSVSDTEEETEAVAGGSACYSSIWKNEMTRYCYAERLDGAAEGEKILLLRSRAELEEYTETYKEMYDLMEFEVVCGVYTEEWFADNDLLVFTYGEIPTILGTVPLAFNDQIPASTIRWGIRISGEEPLCMDSAQNWYVLMDINKGAIDSEDEIVLVMDGD